MRRNQGRNQTEPPVTAALNAQRANGHRIGHVHLRYLNPLPRNLGEVIKRYRKPHPAAVPEIDPDVLERINKDLAKLD